MSGAATFDQERERLNTGLKPVPEENRFDEARLDRWLRLNVEGYAGPLSVQQFRGGQSNPTYRLATPGRAYVLRRKPFGKLLPSAHAVDREYRVISALGPTGFPAPGTHGLCEDESVIGAMFYVMDMVEGRVLWDRALPALEPEQRRAVYSAQIETLARLHNTDYAAVGLADFGKPGNYMGRQLDRWSRQYKASETQSVPEMDRLIAWLPKSLPPQERTSIVHGDFRLDNMVFHPSEPRVLAVLDWELATLGEPLADFTYFLMSWVEGPLADLPDLEARGIPTVAQAAREYGRLTGGAGVEHLDWFLSYNAFRLACIVQGILGRVRDGTANHPQAPTMGPRVLRLAKESWRFAERAGA